MSCRDGRRTLRTPGQREMKGWMMFLRLYVPTVAALLTVACRSNLPRDTVMIAAFNSNKHAFEQVRDVILKAEDIERVEERDAETLPLPTSQRNQIAFFMARTGVTLIRVEKSESGDQFVDFIFHRSGFAFGGALKTVAWSNTNPAPPILDSLDDPTDRRGFVTGTWFRASRPLKDGWYLSLSKG